MQNKLHFFIGAIVLCTFANGMAQASTAESTYNNNWIIAKVPTDDQVLGIGYVRPSSYAQQMFCCAVQRIPQGGEIAVRVGLGKIRYITSRRHSGNCVSIMVRQTNIALPVSFTGKQLVCTTLVYCKMN